MIITIIITLSQFQPIIDHRNDYYPESIKIAKSAWPKPQKQREASKNSWWLYKLSFDNKHGNTLTILRRFSGRLWHQQRGAFRDTKVRREGKDEKRSEMGKEKRKRKKEEWKGEKHRNKWIGERQNSIIVIYSSIIYCFLYIKYFANTIYDLDKWCFEL